MLKLLAVCSFLLVACASVQAQYYQICNFPNIVNIYKQSHKYVSYAICTIQNNATLNSTLVSIIQNDPNLGQPWIWTAGGRTTANYAVFSCLNLGISSQLNNFVTQNIVPLIQAVSQNDANTLQNELTNMTAFYNVLTQNTNTNVTYPIVGELIENSPRMGYPITSVVGGCASTGLTLTNVTAVYKNSMGYKLLVDACNRYVFRQVIVPQFGKSYQMMAGK